MLTRPSFIQRKFLSGLGWLASAWSLCLAAGMVALVAQAIIGPRAWIQALWHTGLVVGVGVLLLGAGSGLLSLGRLVIIWEHPGTRRARTDPSAGGPGLDPGREDR